MDWTTGLLPISSPLLGTLKINLQQIHIFSISFVSSMKPVLIYSIP